MQATNKTVPMKRTAPRNNTAKDYSEFSVEGRKGRPSSRQRKQDRNSRRNWNEEV